MEWAERCPGQDGGEEEDGAPAGMAPGWGQSVLFSYISRDAAATSVQVHRPSMGV